ncbi:hypothetical protein Clacol_002967 [Clathrus columnatus]|uniref:Uncharacterized protein n=1 Tax=Clathrus columnatus TaxID=1419009 RepID=A0AAV5A5K3_9AGAM|nr:hypothetical protein Clacol_002967 [Clathrus columnatus]
MAGLFELQLPNESPRRRSNDAPRSSLAASRPSRPHSPPPEIAAQEILNQVKVRQQQQQSSSSSHFTHASTLFSWRRKTATMPQDSSRVSSDSYSGYSSDTLRHNSTPVASNGRTFRESGKQTITRGPLAHSPRQSFSLDALTPSATASTAYDDASTHSVDNVIEANANSRNNVATTALAQAGFSLSIPSIAFPTPSPTVPSTPKRKKRGVPSRPDTSHGYESPTSPTLLSDLENGSASGTIRRVKSFTKLNGSAQDVVRDPSKAKNGDILVFSRRPNGPALTRSMPDQTSASTMATSSAFSFFSKGKSRETMSDREDMAVMVQDIDSQRGRPTGSSPAHGKEREKSATRRLSWWPRRRVDSSINTTTPSTPPPPIPTRSQNRPVPPAVKVSTPSIPSFRPFSPLMNEFRVSDVKTPQGLTEENYHHVSNRRRHSLSGHSNRSNSTVKPAPPSPTSSQTLLASHKYSLSLSTTEHGFIVSEGALSQSSSPPALSDNISSQLPPTVLTTPPPPSPVSTRPRSNTSTSVDSLIQTNRETMPLLLRQPLTRANSSTDPPDPFHSICSAAFASSRVTNENETLTPLRSNSDPIASSSNSPKSGDILSNTDSNTSMNKLLTTNGSSLPSFPPPTASNRLLRRLSTTLFPSSAPMLTTPIERLSVEMSLPPSSGNVSGANTPRTSGSSPSRSKEDLPPPETRNSIEEGKNKLKNTTPFPDETPENFLYRLLATVTRAEVGHVLASSGDEFYNHTLRLYLTRFKFTEEPLDVALRRLLMEVGLPKETQHIDRMMEAFATRYLDCNSDLFADKDHPYILSFSLIMLHTDAFNKSNKNKMTKGDYVKNARLPGVPPELLEYFYDNIVFAPFIFIEDPADGTVGKTNLDNSRLSSVGAPNTNQTMGNGSSASVLLGKTKIDPYYLIAQNMLGPLRADINTVVPPYSPYLFEGTDWPWDMPGLHRIFALARVFYVSFDPPSPTTPVTLNAPILTSPGRRKSVAVPLPVNLGPFMGSATPPLPIEILPAPRASMVITTSKHGAKALKIAKVGTLLRKDDTVDGGRRSTNRKWREFSVVLTGSQLLFFRNVTIASNLFDFNTADDTRRAETEEALLNPDDVLILSDSIALYDRTYTKYPYAFRFFMPNGRQFILQASDETVRNEWISAINYACSFKSAGVYIRGLGMSHKEIEMTGLAAAASHLKDLRASSKSNGIVHSFTSSLKASPNPSPVSPDAPNPQAQSSPVSNRLVIISNQVDLESPRSLQLEDSRLFKQTFDEVKAELAYSAGLVQLQGRSRTLSMSSRPVTTTKITRPSTAGSMTKSQDSHSLSSPMSRSRRDLIQTHVDLLNEKINEMQVKLEEELRLTRNFGILTPFQRSTRDRIQTAVLPLAKKISSLRIEITKYTCYRFVLLSDLAEEERQWEQAKRDALQAASHRLSLDAENVLDITHPAEDAEEKQVKVSRSASTLESFYSAPGTPAISMGTRPSLSAISTDLPTFTGQSSELPTPAMGQSPLALESLDTAGELHERFYSAVETIEEIAEEWNETRAAKRVSLVRVPSNVKPGRTLRNNTDFTSQ